MSKSTIINEEIISKKIAKATQKMAVLRGKADGLLEEYNELFQDEKLTDAIQKAKALDGVIADYNMVAQKKFFEECKATENPMLHAITELSYTTLVKKDEREEGEILPTRVITERESIVDLLKLQKHCGKTIGINPQWQQRLNELYCVCVIKVCDDSDKDPTKLYKDSENIRRLSKVFEGKPDGVTGKQLDKYIQATVDAILGEGYKVHTTDRRYIYNNFHKKSNKAFLTNGFVMNKKFIGLVTEVCHRLITGKSYNVDGKLKEF